MRRFVLSLIFSLLIMSAIAQQFGIAMVAGIPRNEFRVATKAEGYGLNLTMLFPLGSKVVNVGGNVNYMIYGLHSQDHDLQATITSSNGQQIAVLDIPLRVVNTNSIFGMHAMMRITAPTEKVRPYFEGLFGFRYISTSTRIVDRSDTGFWSNDEEDNVLVRKTNLGDAVLSYGGGGGLQLNIGENAYLDVRAYYLLGKAKFYDASDTRGWEVRFNDVSANYDPNNLDPNDFSIGGKPRESTTDMLMVQMGATFKF